MSIYPPTRTVDATEELSGVTAPDPYRWLEHGANDDVRAWQRAQNEHTESVVRAAPGYATVRELAQQHSAPRFASVPVHADGKWFREYTAEGSPQSGVLVADEPYGEGRVVYEPRHDPSGAPPFLSWFAPSPDGSVLAVGVCRDGSEQNGIELIDAVSGATLPGAPTPPLMDNWSGGAHWLPDSSGFYYTALDGASIDVTQYVVFHHMATGTTTRIDVPWTRERDYRMVLPSFDGTRLVAIERLMAPVPVAVADLDDPAAPQWRPFVTDTDASLPGCLLGERFVAVTDLDAPRGRVVAIDLDKPEPEAWTTIVPESDAVLRGLTAVGDMLYVSEFIDTYARVRIFNQSGGVAGEVPLPGKGAMGELPFPFLELAQPHVGRPGEYLFAHSTLISSWGVYRHRPGDVEIEVLQEPAVTVADAVVEDIWATSKDGTRIPYHIVRRTGSDPAAPQPTLIYAYGGFNAPWVPQYPPGGQAAFVAAGGNYVHGHLRGGAEFGRDWWNGGRMSTKQNCYDDLYAIAEQLIAGGRTTPAKLAITGGSNGGLLTGVAVTQRPDLWAAAVPRVPLLDLLGACREQYGRYAVSLDIGDPDDPDEVRRMLSISPYHLIENREYPAVYIDAGDTDPRCSPWHARKFAARLQTAQQGDAPILLRIWENAGHGFATDKQITVEQTAGWLTFLLDRLR